MELLRALGALTEPPSPATQPLAEALGLGDPPDATAHAALFTFELYPYASVYLGAEGQLGGEARDRIAGFWRALGLEPPTEPDHLATLLALQASLAELEEHTAGSARERWRHARRAHLEEHLLSWLPPYLARMLELGDPSYRRWAELLGETLAVETRALGGTEEPPQSLHLRTAPPLRDPRTEGGQSLLEDLLTPVRSGLILTRTDLARAARELGLGLRQGERRYVLQALLGQDAAGMLGWLAKEATRQGKVLIERTEEMRLPVPAHWPARVEATGKLLRNLARESDP
ncbi:MAG: molecular chaperone TorD family protein [Acidobacteria bacterium]|nr:molecular chaperone TorD family protein [Acidobacteriota bacterium]